jgi:hypothetical protein
MPMPSLRSRSLLAFTPELALFGERVLPLLKALALRL